MTAPRRSAVLASAHRFCRVCGGRRVVALASLVGMRGAGVAACVHCTPTAGLDVVEINEDYPFRIDRPRGETA